VKNDYEFCSVLILLDGERQVQTEGDSNVLSIWLHCRSIHICEHPLHTFIFKSCINLIICSIMTRLD
jgi:hypothetical protein